MQKLVHQEFAELASPTPSVSPGQQPCTKQVVDSSVNQMKIGTGRRNQIMPALAGSICIAQVNVLFSSAPLVANSQATAAEIVSLMQAHAFRCVLDGVFVNLVHRSNKQTATACISNFSVLQQRDSHRLFREDAAQKLPLISSHARCTHSQVSKLRSQGTASMLSTVFAAWSRAAKVRVLSCSV